MYAGQIVETGMAEEVFAKPLHPYTQGLLDCIPIPGKTKPGEHLGSIPGIVPNLIGDLYGCTFRDRCAYAHEPCAPEDVGLNRIGPGRAYRCVLPHETDKPRRTTRPHDLAGEAADCARPHRTRERSLGREGGW